MAIKLLGRFKYWLLALVGLFFLALLIHNSFNYLDPDFGWHYQVGQEIWQEQQVPDIEHHLFTVAGKSWVDHEWLANVLIYLLNDSLGYLAVSLVFVLLIFTAWLILAKFAISKWLGGRADSIFLWLLLALGLKACLPHFGVRIQEITVLFLLILNIWLLAVAQRQVWKKWEFLVLPVFFWLWACLHGGFLIGLAALLAWIAFKGGLRIINRFFPKIVSPNNLLPFKTLVQSIVMAGLSIGATCLTPYGLRLYGFLADYQSNKAYLRLIKEWFPMIFDILSWRMVYSLFFGVALALLAITFYFQRKSSKIDPVIKWFRDQDWWMLAFSLVLFLAAWKSVRHFPLFFIISLPWLAGFYYQLGRHSFRLDQWSVYLKIFLATIILLVSALLLITANWTNSPAQSYCSFYPCAALEHLRQTPYANWPTVVDYGWGGYFYWLWPEKQIFIDGRLPQYQWRDRSLIEHYSRFFAEQEVQTALSDYDLSVVVIGQPKPRRFNWLEIWLLGKGQSINDYDSLPETIRRAMLKMPDWQMIYSDSTATIYVRQ